MAISESLPEFTSHSLIVSIVHSFKIFVLLVAPLQQGLSH